MDRGAWQETEHTYTHETSLVVQWLRLHASKAGDVGSIAGRGNEIPHAMRWDKKKNVRSVLDTGIIPCPQTTSQENFLKCKTRLEKAKCPKFTHNVF